MFAAQRLTSTCSEPQIFILGVKSIQAPLFFPPFVIVPSRSLAPALIFLSPLLLLHIIISCVFWLRQSLLSLICWLRRRPFLAAQAARRSCLSCLDLTQRKYRQQIILSVSPLNNGQFLSSPPCIIYSPTASIFNPSAQFPPLLSCDLERN